MQPLCLNTGFLPCAGKGRRVIIKKRIFEKNRDTHGELTPEDSRDILNRALYNPDIVGENQPVRRPDYKVAIQTGDKNAVVVLDVYAGKENIEIVGWRKIDAKGLEKIKRQAEREDGQLLILPSETSEEAGALSGPTSDSPSKGKVNALSGDKQAESEESFEFSPEDKRGEGSVQSAVKTASGVVNTNPTKENLEILNLYYLNGR